MPPRRRRARRSSRRCCRCSPAPGATRPRRMRSAGRRAPPSTRRTSAWRAAIGAEPRAIVFTSGGTEAINLALKGAAWAGKATGHRIVTSAVEHDAVLNACPPPGEVRLRAASSCPWTATAAWTPTSCPGALTEKTVLVSLQLANNEVGTVGPTAELDRAGPGRLPGAHPRRRRPGGALAAHRRRGPGRRPASPSRATSSRAPRASARSGSAAGVAILPQQHGGSQERYRRAGTEHVAGAVGMAVALELTVAERAGHHGEHVRGLRDRLLRRAAVAAGRGAHRPPARPAAEPRSRSWSAMRRARRSTRHGAGPRGRVLLHGLGLRVGLHGAIARADRHGLPA